MLAYAMFTVIGLHLGMFLSHWTQLASVVPSKQKLRSYMVSNIICIMGMVSFLIIL